MSEDTGKDTMTTEERIAFEENDLRNLQAALEARQDWASSEERDEAFREFHGLARLLRALHRLMRSIDD